MDKEKKIQRNIIILIVGTILLLIALITAWYFLLFKPLQTEMTEARNKYETRRTVAVRLEQALVNQRKAEDNLVDVRGQWQLFQRLYRSMEFGALGADPATETPLQKAERDRTWRAWMREYYNDYAAALLLALDSAAARSGVNLERSVDVANPPQTPEDVVAPTTGFLKPTLTQGASGANSPTSSISAPPSGSAPSSSMAMPGAGGATNRSSTPGSVPLKVTGSFPQIIDFFQRFNNSPILMVVQNISLSSTRASGANTNAPAGGLASSAPQTLSTQSTQTRAATTVPQVTATFDIVPYLITRGKGAEMPTGGGTAAAASTANPMGSAGQLAVAPGVPPTTAPTN